MRLPQLSVPKALRPAVHYIFQRPKFCCCLPVRVCVIVTSLLAFLVASLLSLVIWFEVASTPTLTSGERSALVGAGVVETLLAVICAIGFIGSLIHKQTFVTTYCVGLYIHFTVHFVVAAVFLFKLLHTSHADGIVACQHAIQDPSAQQQCLDLLHVVTGIFAGVAAAVLTLELYSAIVATRFVYSTKEHKRLSRLPLHARGKSETVPSFVRYQDAEGNTVYDRHYYPQPDPVSGSRAYSPLIKDSYHDGYGGDGYDSDDDDGADAAYDPYRSPVGHADEDGAAAHHVPPSPSSRGVGSALPTPTDRSFVTAPEGMSRMSSAAVPPPPPGAAPAAVG